MYPTGMERSNPTSCSSSDIYFGIRKEMEGKYSGIIHIRMWASARPTLQRYVGPSMGSTAKMESSSRWRDFTNHITSLWDSALAISLIPFHEKL